MQALLVREPALDRNERSTDIAENSLKRRPSGAPSRDPGNVVWAASGPLPAGEVGASSESSNVEPGDERTEEKKR